MLVDPKDVTNGGYLQGGHLEAGLIGNKVYFMRLPMAVTARPSKMIKTEFSSQIYFGVRLEVIERLRSSDIC